MTEQNTLSISELQQKAEMGDAQAQLELAYCLLRDIASDENSAFQWLNKSAELGNPEAQLALGLCFMSGQVSHNDYFGVLSNEFYERWNNKEKLYLGILFAFYVIQLSLLTGNHDFDDNLAFSWLLKSAEQGCGEAQYWLARCYQTGSGIQQNNEIAFSLFKKRADQGLSDAFYWLAQCYAKGEGVEKNNELAIYWLTKWVDLQQEKDYDEDYVNACLLLGDLYADGKGVQENNKLAYEWYVKVDKISHDKIVSIENNIQWQIQANRNNIEFNNDQEAVNRKSPWLKLLGEVSSRVHELYYNSATISGISDKDACIWYERLAKFDHAESQLWLAKYYLQGGLLEQSVEPLSDDSCKQLIRKGYINAWDLAEKAVRNDCAEANLVLGFIEFYNILDPHGRDTSSEYFIYSIGHSEQGIAEYFLVKLYQYSDNEEHRQLKDQYKNLADLEKVWSYYRIDRLLENDNNILEKIDALIKDSDLITKNKELKKLNERLLFEIQEKKEAYKALHEKEKEMLSFFTHTMRNALATAPESLRQAIQLLGGDDVYEHDAKHYKAINKIAALFSTLSLTDCLIDTFKQSISDPQEFKQAWENDCTGDATPKWVIASSLRQSLNRIFFMSDASELRKLLDHPETAAIKTARKSFIDQVLPLNVDHEGVKRLYSWVDQHLPSIEVSITDADEFRFGANRTRFSLLFAITSELILNALKYWDGEDKLQISWKLADSGFFVFSVKNHCLPNAMSNLAGSHKGLAFINRLIELLGEQASFVCGAENGFFVAELTLNKSLLGDG